MQYKLHLTDVCNCYEMLELTREIIVPFVPADGMVLDDESGSQITLRDVSWQIEHSRFAAIAVWEGGGQPHWLTPDKFESKVRDGDGEWMAHDCSGGEYRRCYNERNR